MRLTPRAAMARLLQSPEFQQFEAELGRVSAFHVLGIERRELSHAALLGWLLDPRAHHGLGAAPLRSLLLLGCALAPTDAVGPDAVDIDDLDLHGARVELEHAVRIPRSRRTRRLDVVVSVPHGDGCRVVLVVEYKVDASETDDQTIDYATWADHAAREEAWPAPPLLVYLCPGRSDPASDRFVVLDYDAYLPWLDSLLADRPAPTAAFLIDELRTCLGTRSDVQDDQQDALRDTLLREQAEAIDVLRSMPRTEPDLRATIRRHLPALQALGLFHSRRSKGHSAFVSAFREVLRDHLDDHIWSIGGGEGSLVAIYRPAVRVLREVTATERAPTAYLRLHVFMERPRNGSTRAILEVVGNHPHLDPVESRALRERLASDLRSRFGVRFDEGTRGQIVGAWRLPAPGIRTVKDDVQRHVDGSSELFHAKAAAIRDLGDALGDWLGAFRAAIEDGSS